MNNYYHSMFSRQPAPYKTDKITDYVNLQFQSRIIFYKLLFNYN